MYFLYIMISFCFEMLISTSYTPCFINFLVKVLGFVNFFHLIIDTVINSAIAINFIVLRKIKQNIRIILPIRNWNSGLLEIN